MSLENTAFAHYQQFTACVEQMKRARRAMIGKRVEYYPFGHEPTAPMRGTIREMSSTGLKVRWDGDSIARYVHADDVRYTR
jgi:hypothetical protein